MKKQAIFCSVYKTTKHDGMYLYVERKTQPFEKLPETLMCHFGQPIHVMDLLLTKDKKFARVTSEVLLDRLAETGFFLQLPPVDGQGNA